MPLTNVALLLRQVQTSSMYSPDCSHTTLLSLQAVSVQPTRLLFLSPLNPEFHPSVPATYLKSQAEAASPAENQLAMYRLIVAGQLWWGMVGGTLDVKANSSP